MKITLVSTTLNEERSIAQFIQSILGQSKQPDEIIILDAGSKDKTVEIIQSYIHRGAPITLLISRGANRSKGRNIAIRKARYDIIASADAGCKLKKDWLEKITAPLETEDVDIVSGFYLPEAKNLFQQTVAAVTVPTVKEVNPETFLPSSRSVAFRKKAWEKVGGYPEWTSHSEDTLFDLSLKRYGFKFRFVPEAIVHWQMKTSPLQVFLQFFRYARSDGQIGLFFPHYFKIYVYALGIILLISGFFWPLLWAILGVLILFYFLRQIFRAHHRCPKFSVSLLSPLVIITVDLGNISGYFFGWLERIFKPELRKNLAEYLKQ